MLRKVVVTVVVAVAVRFGAAIVSTFTNTAIIVSIITVSSIIVSCSSSVDSILFLSLHLLRRLKLSNEVKLNTDEEPNDENYE